MSEAEAAPRDLSAAGERIEQLLAAMASSGHAAQERAEELVRLVAELYGAGLERVLDIVYDAGALSPTVLDGIADDELVASLLLVHGLHPYDLDTRIERALDKVRPYLGSHGGDVDYLGVNEEGVARLRLTGSCHGCPSSSVTLKLAVEGAIEAAAPEVTSIECEDAPAVASPALIPVESLLSRTRAEQPAGSPVWTPLDTDAVGGSEARLVDAAGLAVVVCRVGATWYAYRDGCAACGASLSSAALERPLGSPLGSAVLTCPDCRTHYDVRLAGVGIERPDLHLEPLPLLVQDGRPTVAVPGAVPA